MELPVHDSDPLTKRYVIEVRRMAVAVQANLVQLKVADAKRRRIDPANHDLGIVAPGKVSHFRETLIDRHTIKAYSHAELQLRLHEIWGRFCLMGWLFFQDGGKPLVNFAVLPKDVAMRCSAELNAKLAEVHAILWRLQFEQQRRMDMEKGQKLSHEADETLAAKIPVIVLGEDVDDASDEAVVRVSCEHAGMLGVLRWMIEPHAAWDDPLLMYVDADPFVFT